MHKVCSTYPLWCDRFCHKMIFMHSSHPKTDWCTCFGNLGDRSRREVFIINVRLDLLNIAVRYVVLGKQIRKDHYFYADSKGNCWKLLSLSQYYHANVHPHFWLEKWRNKFHLYGQQRCAEGVTGHLKRYSGNKDHLVITIVIAMVAGLALDLKIVQLYITSLTWRFFKRYETESGFGIAHQLTLSNLKRPSKNLAGSCSSAFPGSQ